MDKDQEKSTAKEAPTAKDNKIIFAEILKKKKKRLMKRTSRIVKKPKDQILEIQDRIAPKE